MRWTRAATFRTLLATAWLAAGVGLMAVACQSPEAFRANLPGGPIGVGGSISTGGDGTGGIVATGGAGTGGLAIGTGGAGTGGLAIGTGGKPAGTGGAGTGGRLGTGGAAAGGAGGPGGAGAGAAGGAGGGIGMGGMSGQGGGDAPCTTCALSIQCQNPQPTDNTAMSALLWISNTGATPISIGQIKIRYYYTNETGMDMTLDVPDKSFKPPSGAGYRPTTATFTATNGMLATSTPPMAYTDVAIGGTDMLDMTLPFYFKMSLHTTGYAKLDQTNDYSNGPAAVGPCPHIVAFVGVTMAAGVPPP